MFRCFMRPLEKSLGEGWTYGILKNLGNRFGFKLHKFS
uniref:Uncharacterized protein n=1 Tax=Rhizophora mucronata TaxID=61149 RepID=A0A2P2PFX0_RHIMU